MRLFAGVLLTLALAGMLVAQQSSAPAPQAGTPSPAAPNQSASQDQAAPPQPSVAQPPAASPRPGDTSTKPAAGQTPEKSDKAVSSPSAAASPAASGSQAASAPQAAPAASTSAIVLPEDPKELAEARNLFKSGTKLKSGGKLDDAFNKFERASELAPHNVEYLTAREFTRQQLVMQALKDGNQAMLNNNDIVALASFRRALEYDPTNEFALQRLRDAIPPDHEASSLNVRVVERSAPVTLQPTPITPDFHFRGDAKQLLTQLAQVYGLTAQFDDSVQSRRVRFDIDSVNFRTAVEAAERVTKTFWVPLSAKQILFVADTAENRRSFERMSLRTFYLTDLNTEQELTEMMNSLRVLLNLRYVVADRAESTISIRAEEPVAEAAQRLLQSLSGGRPEVLLDMQVYEISSTLMRQIGTLPPAQFTIFNISPALLAGLGANAQNLINQLISSGAINQGNSQAIQALLAQLQSQSSSSSILNTPFATFGGGKTLFGVSGGTGITTNLQLNESDIKTLDHVTLRASQNTAAVLKVGQRYPIVNATFAPIYNSSAISRVLGNQSYIAPFPSFNFEDLGIDLKATPIIHSDRDVSLKLELKIRSLGTQTVNGIPIINNREYTGNITAKNGESSVVAGLISRSDSRSIVGLPGLALVPGVTYTSSNHTKDVEEDQLFVIITPHVIRLPENSSFALELPAGH
jgi:general secretion pathway protein D